MLPFRLIIYTVVPLFVMFFGIGFIIINVLEDEFESRMEDEVQMVARALQLPMSDALERNQPNSIQNALDSAWNIGRVYGAYLYDASGELIATTGPSQSTNDRGLATEILRDGMRTGDYGRVAGRSVYSYFVPLTGHGSQIIGLLQITRRERDMREVIGGLRFHGMVIMGGAAFLLIVIVLLGYYGAIGRALSAFRQSMQRVENGDRSHRASTDGPVEVGQLALTFNAMMDAIAAAEKELRFQRTARRELETRLRQSEKLAAIGQLSAGVAHELGTPLSVISGRAQRLMRRQRQLTPDIYSALQSIRQEVHRMERIIRQLLDFGRSPSTNHQPISISYVVQNVRQALAMTIQDGNIRVEIPGSNNTAKIVANAVRIEQALTNLMKNAIQAAEHKIRIDWYEEEGDVVILVEDDGKGIQDDIKHRLYEPFFTTKNVDEGTGLGLAIVYAVVEEHGARLSVEKSELGGAKFMIRFKSIATVIRKDDT